METDRIWPFACGLLVGAWLSSNSRTRRRRRRRRIPPAIVTTNSLASQFPPLPAGPKILEIRYSELAPDHLACEWKTSNWLYAGFHICWHRALERVRSELISKTNIYFECDQIRLLEREWRLQ